METSSNRKLRIKYNRISTIQQSGNRFELDTDNYDLTMLDKVSGKIPFSERTKGAELLNKVKENIVAEVVVEELSRLGRNTGDCITTLEFFERNRVNVVVRNLGIQSRPNGKKNPVWKIITSIISSMYEMELENIKERTMAGRQAYVMNGGTLGRPNGTSESDKCFLEKEKTKAIIKKLNKGWTIREITKNLETSNKTVIKAKRLGQKYELLS